MTTKQMQHLMNYLGYDTGGCDGISGPKTQKAMEDFREEYVLTLPGQEILEMSLIMAVGEGWQRPEAQEGSQADDGFVPESGPMTAEDWNMIEYFEREEFRCPCGKCGGFPVEPDRRLVWEVNTMRKAMDVPIIIVPPDGHSGGSGIRCAAYNATLKGSVPNSKHLKGLAADAIVSQKPASAVEAYLNKIQSAGKISYWYRIASGSYHMEI